MEIILGKTEVSMLNPPNEGVVIDNGYRWQIARNGNGEIILKEIEGLARHPEFDWGMSMLGFCCWINSKL